MYGYKYVCVCVHANATKQLKIIYRFVKCTKINSLAFVIVLTIIVGLVAAIARWQHIQMPCNHMHMRWYTYITVCVCMCV